MGDQQLLDADLMDSIESYDFDRFKHLLEDGANPNSLHFQQHIGFMTPLMEASNSNDPRYVIELLKYGADPNIVTDSGFALQHALANDNSMRVLYHLLKNGANPFLKDEDGETAYDMAVNDNWINFTEEIDLLKDAMLRRLQSRTRRFLTRKRVKRNKRLAVSKHMLDDNNPMSYMDYDTMLELSRYM